MEIEVRPIVPAEIPEFRRLLSQAFGGDAIDDDESRQRFVDQVDLQRTYAPFDGDEIVGTAASFSFDVSLPGGSSTAMGGLTMVSVLPTHRRRGLLNRLIGAHFADCQERGESLTGLWASEYQIYGRYGYGEAAPTCDISIDARSVGVPAARDDVRLVDGDEARRVFPEIYERVYAARPGRLSRSENYWEHRHFYDPPERRSGASARRYVVAYREGEAVGYTTFRQKSKWENSVAAGLVSVGELFGIDSAARLSLWSLVCSVDLFPNVRAANVPIDFELPWQAARPQMIERRVLDGIFLRLLDVPRALGARGYVGSDSMVMEVADPMGIAGGTFRVDVSAGVATCAEVADAPDVGLDIAALSSVYLGADLVGPLSRAGRITGSAEALQRLRSLLRSDVAPCCPEIF